MLNISFSQSEVDLLFKERYSHPHSWVQKRMEALYLKSQKISHSEIRRLVKISSRTLVRWIRMYQDGGIEALKVLGWKGAKGALAEHRESLEEYFTKNPPISLKEACAKIKELTGIERRKIAVRDFLKSLGMSFRKTGNVPGKANREKQEEFKKKLLNHSSRKQKKANGNSSLSMRRISSGRGSWDFYGV